ncbi:MAG: hypothetical protein J6W29_00655 [Neisseriaceae bacterium]|nr:hypothetical protein [Neisseriaceae bacterium]
MKKLALLTALISALVFNAADAKTPMKTSEKTVSQTAKITQKDFDKLENMDTADFLKNSKWTPIIKSKIGVDNHKFLLDEINNKTAIVLVSATFTKTADTLNNNIYWYSNSAWYKYSGNNLVCITLNTNKELYIAFLDKNNNINIKRTQQNNNISFMDRNSLPPNEFNECVSRLIASSIG